MNAEAEKRKGFTLAIEGEPIHLPLVYGRQKVGGVRTYHKTTKSRVIVPKQDGVFRFQIGLSEGTYTSSTNDYLWVQQALCFGGIDSVVDVEVDSSDWDMKDFSHLLDFNVTGGVANATATASGIPATNKFTNTAYMTAVFALNRDDPQYNGVPDVSAYVRGQKVHSIVSNDDEYSLSEDKSYSNNPALVLLDYLIRPKTLGGCGYDLSEINLPSFYRAMVICNLPVAEDVPVVGRINGVRPVMEGETPTASTRHIRLYECNLTLDTNETRRDNIERILETMAQSDLIWSEGQYKLILDYPADLVAQNALITATYSDDDIIDESIDITWAGVQDRFNRATVKFLNEELDFAQDSVSWPTYGSEVHSDYLSEDNGVENDCQYFQHGATHRRSALAKAEEIVRSSRLSKILDFELNREALIHEQGDLIRVSSSSAQISNEVYRIEDIKITDNLTVRISAVRFDYSTLAYNVTDSSVTPPKVLAPAGIPNVTDLTWHEGSRIGELANGWLTWSTPADDSIRRFVIYYRASDESQYIMLGDTTLDYFDIPAQLNDGTDYYFIVRTENKRGRMSTGAVILLDQLGQLIPVTGLTAAAGGNSVKLTWVNTRPELTLRYDVYQGSTNVRSNAVLVASTTTIGAVISPLEVDEWWFWVDVIGLDGTVAMGTTPAHVEAIQLGTDIREFDFQGVDWSTSGNTLSWGAGTVIKRNGSSVSTASISAGSVTWTSGAIYVYYDEATGAFENTTTLTTALDSPMKRVVATYRGGTDVINGLHEPIIDGSKIITGTIGASQIVGGSITANELAAGAVTADKLNVTSLDAVSATIGTLKSATTGARMEIHTDRILIYDASNVLRVKIGNLT